MTEVIPGDGELVARCRAGDQEAWALLVERYSRYVYAIAVQGFRLAAADAEDVFQDTFLRVYERLETLRNDEALRPWIAQVTRRLCLDRLAAAGRASRRAAGRGSRRRTRSPRSTRRSTSTRRWPRSIRPAASCSTASSRATSRTA